MALRAVIEIERFTGAFLRDNAVPRRPLSAVENRGRGFHNTTQGEEGSHDLRHRRGKPLPSSQFPIGSMQMGGSDRLSPWGSSARASGSSSGVPLPLQSCAVAASGPSLHPAGPAVFECRPVIMLGEKSLNHAVEAHTRLLINSAVTFYGDRGIRGSKMRVRGSCGPDPR